MEKLLKQIKELKFTTGPNFKYNLNKEFEIISSYLTTNEKEDLKKDFEVFLNKGKFLVFNTFCGGIIFFKEPNYVEKIKIRYNTTLRTMEVSIKFKIAKKEKDNAMHRCDFWKSESITWNIKEIFPNFFKYKNNIQIALMVVIGRIAKRICEYGRESFAYMMLVNEFPIELVIDNRLESILNVNNNIFFNRSEEDNDTK